MIDGPVRYWFRNDLTFFVSTYLVRPWIDLYLWFKHRRKKFQTHVIRPRFLKPGPHDSKERILHGVMEVFCHACETKSVSVGDLNLLQYPKYAEIYDWWMAYQDKESQYPEMPAKPDDWNFEMEYPDENQNHPYVLAMTKFREECRQLMLKWEREEREYLIRVIESSPFIG